MTAPGSPTRLLVLQDKDYQAFLARLLPTLDSSTIIEIGTPALRKLAKEFSRQPETAEFLRTCLGAENLSENNAAQAGLKIKTIQLIKGAVPFIWAAPLFSCSEYAERPIFLWIC